MTTRTWRRADAVARQTQGQSDLAATRSEISALGLDEPAGDLLEGQITNEWAKQPDSSKWYKGLDDLSASVWAYADSRSLQVLVSVKDDTARDGDEVSLSIAGLDGVIRTFAASDSKIAVIKSPGQSGATWYRFTIPRTAIALKVVSINLTVQDDDFGGTKQTADWFPAKSDPAQWWQCVLP